MTCNEVTFTFTWESNMRHSFWGSIIESWRYIGNWRKKMVTECRCKILKINNLEDHKLDGKIKVNCNVTSLYLRNSDCNGRQRLLSLRVEHLGLISRFFKRIYLAFTQRNARPVFTTWEVRTSAGTTAILSVCQGKCRGSRPKPVRPRPLPFVSFPTDHITSVPPSTL